MSSIIIMVLGGIVLVAGLFVGVVGMLTGEFAQGLETLLSAVVSGALLFCIGETNMKVRELSQQLNELTGGLKKNPAARTWMCPNCGKSNPRHVGTCESCGETKPN